MSKSDIERVEDYLKNRDKDVSKIRKIWGHAEHSDHYKNKAVKRLKMVNRVYKKCLGFCEDAARNNNSNVVIEFTTKGWFNFKTDVLTGWRDPVPCIICSFDPSIKPYLIQKFIDQGFDVEEKLNGEIFVSWK